MVTIASLGTLVTVADKALISYWVCQIARSIAPHTTVAVDFAETIVGLRANWCSELPRGKRFIRLRTANCIILDLTETEMAKLSAENLVARLKEELAS